MASETNFSAALATWRGTHSALFPTHLTPHRYKPCRATKDPRRSGHRPRRQPEGELRRTQSPRRQNKGCLILPFSCHLSSPFTEFKRIPDDEKLNAFRGLLKGASHTPPTYRSSSPSQHTNPRSTASQNAQKPQRVPFSTYTRSSQRPPTRIPCSKLLL